MPFDDVTHAEASCHCVGKCYEFRMTSATRWHRNSDNHYKYVCMAKALFMRLRLLQDSTAMATCQAEPSNSFHLHHFHQAEKGPSFLED